MLTKQETVNLMEKISNIYGYFYKKSHEEKNAILNAYIKELGNYTYEDIANAIDNLSKTNAFVPTVAQIKVEINNQELNFKNMNLNSSYWYVNLREHCDKENIPYYDIEKGPDFPLTPFKGDK